MYTGVRAWEKRIWGEKVLPCVGEGFGPKIEVVKLPWWRSVPLSKPTDIPAPGLKPVKGAKWLCSNGRSTRGATVMRVTGLYACWYEPKEK